jgi:hypothetical protein
MDCVCGQLEDLGIYTDGLAAKVAHVMSSDDPMIHSPSDTCVKMMINQDYGVKEACTICDGLRASAATDEELIIEAIAQFNPAMKSPMPKPMGGKKPMMAPTDGMETDMMPKPMDAPGAPIDPMDTPAAPMEMPGGAPDPMAAPAPMEMPGAAPDPMAAPAPMPEVGGGSPSAPMESPVDTMQPSPMEMPGAAPAPMPAAPMAAAPAPMPAAPMPAAPAPMPAAPMPAAAPAPMPGAGAVPNPMDEPITEGMPVDEGGLGEELGGLGDEGLGGDMLGGDPLGGGLEDDGMGLEDDGFEGDGMGDMGLEGEEDVKTVVVEGLQSIIDALQGIGEIDTTGDELGGLGDEGFGDESAELGDMDDEGDLDMGEVTDGVVDDDDGGDDIPGVMNDDDEGGDDLFKSSDPEEGDMHDHDHGHDEPMDKPMGGHDKPMHGKEMRGKPMASAASTDNTMTKEASTDVMDQMLYRMKRGTITKSDTAIDNLFEGLLSANADFVKSASKSDGDVKTLKRSEASEGSKLTEKPCQDSPDIGKIKDGKTMGHEEALNLSEPDVARDGALIGEEEESCKLNDKDRPSVPQGSKPMDESCFHYQ